MRDFNMRRGYRNLLVAMLRQREPSGIARAIIEDTPDVVLDTGSWWWIAVVQRELKGRFPFAQIIHDVRPHPGPTGILYELHRLFYPSKADAVISLSEHVYRDLVRVYPGKAHILSRHGIILTGSSIDSEAVADRHRQFLFFGRIDRYKGLDILVKAFEIAQREDPAVRLEIVGSGRIRARLRRKIESLGITLVNRWVSEEEAASAIARCGVIVLPYTSATQSGVAAAALANGIPAIATNVGALPEQIIDGANGLIVPPGSPEALARAMVTISADRELALRMSREAARIGQEDFNWDTIAVKLVKDLEMFLSDYHSREGTRAAPFG